MLVLQSTQPAQFHGIFDDLLTKVGEGAKTVATTLKDLTTVRTTHQVEIVLPPLKQVLIQIGLPLILTASAITGAVVLTRRLSDPARCAR